MNSYQAIIFDLGNVVINISVDNVFDYWANTTGLVAQDLKRNFHIGNVYAQFERGEIDSPTFRKYVLERLKLEINDAEFDRGWNTIYLDIVPGVEDVLRSLKKNFRLVALTNTNEIHAKVWKRKYSPMLGHFEKVFCSHEIGARKPEQKAYLTVLEYLKLKPCDVVFLDDLYEAVHGASEMGITSVLVSSLEQMISELHKLRIL